jgi:hypothetical protein
MSIRFAPSASHGRFPACAPIVRALVSRAVDRAANDNRVNDEGDHMLRAALRHFAQHGLGAARAARVQAEKAFFAGDRQTYDWWIAITRTLDRRIALEAERTLGAATAPV